MAAIHRELTHIKWMLGVTITLNLLILGTLLLFKP